MSDSKLTIGLTNKPFKSPPLNPIEEVIEALFTQDYCTHEQKKATIDTLDLLLQLNLTPKEKDVLMRLNAKQTLTWLKTREQVEIKKQYNL